MPRDLAQGAVIALVLVGATLLIGTIVVGEVYDASPDVDEELNTTETVDFANNSVLDPGEEVSEWDDTIEVTNSSGTVLTAGTDYEWFPSNASINWINTSSLTDGESVTVVAGYTSPPDAAENNIGRIGSGFDLGSILPIVIAASAVLGYLMVDFGGSGGNGGTGRRSQRR